VGIYFDIINLSNSGIWVEITAGIMGCVKLIKLYIGCPVFEPRSIT